MNSSKLLEKFIYYVNRIPYFALAVLYGGYLYYDLRAFTSDPQSPVMAKQSEIDAIKQQNTQLQEKIKTANEFYRTLQSKKGELRILAGQLEEMKVTLSEDLDVASFIKLMVTEAKRSGLSVASIKPMGTKKKEYYQEQAFELIFKGVYFQTVLFLHRISSVEKILRVDEVELRPISPGTDRFVELEAKFQIKAFQYIGSMADEIASGKAGAKLPAGAEAPAASTAPAPVQPAQGGSH